MPIYLSTKEAVATIGNLVEKLPPPSSEQFQKAQELAQNLQKWLNESSPRPSNIVAFLAVLTVLASHARSGLEHIERPN